MIKPLAPKNKRNSADTSTTPRDGPFQVSSLLKHFPALTPEKIQRLATEMSVTRFKRGSPVPAEIHSRTDILLVLSGAIAITWNHDGVNRVLVTLLAPGEMFGVSSSLPSELAQGLRGHAFIDSVVGTIDSAKLVNILLGVGLEAFRSATAMTMGWSSNTLWRYIKMFRLLPRDRLVIALLEMGAKFGVRDSRGLILNLPITQKDLASLLGASRQTVNTDLGHLVRSGAVLNLRRPLVLIPEKLSALFDDSGDYRQGAADNPSALQAALVPD
jgi:CRP/FNR family transcriptional regulator